MGEQAAAGSTFGFGVVLIVTAQRNIAQADPEVHELLLSMAHPGAPSRLALPHGVAGVRGDGTLGIDRAILLRGLARLAEEVGVEIRYGHHQRCPPWTPTWSWPPTA